MPYCRRAAPGASDAIVAQASLVAKYAHAFEDPVRPTGDVDDRQLPGASPRPRLRPELKDMASVWEPRSRSCWAYDRHIRPISPMNPSARS
jgi:hypothetical protein